MSRAFVGGDATGHSEQHAPSVEVTQHDVAFVGAFESASNMGG